jgi:hypothetical protein
MSNENQPQGSSLATRSHARRLSTLGYCALGVGALAYWFNSPWQSSLLNLLAIGICVLGILPVLRWLHRHDQAYPLLEVLQLTMVPFYALPLLTEHEAVLVYPESVLIRASWLVLVFQIGCQIGGRFADSARIEATPGGTWWSDELISDRYLKFTSYSLVLTTGWFFITAFTNWVPPDLIGTLRAIFFGIGIISAFLQARMWGSGTLSPGQKTLFVVNITLQVLLSSLGLLLITSLVTVLLVLVGYFSTARRIPLAVCLVAVSIFAVLHGGKHKMREIYWGEQAHAVTLTDVPAFYQEWISYGLAGGFKIAGREDSAGNSSLLDRASLFQIVCYTIDTVPDRSPFLGGATYSYVLPQIIPRFLWPNKPSPNDSVKMLSVRLGMLSEEQSESTSIGYGLIAESYANFGYYGCGLLALFLGWGARRVALSTAACSALSFGGIFRILCLAWCLNSETTLAVWLSSLYQACIAIAAPLLIYRSIIGGK